jgi:hypothetical protein
MSEFERCFEGREVLQKLLEQSGTLADVDDVARAFSLALTQHAPPQAVIEALWDDEPRFESSRHAQRLFSNLLGLFDALGSGTPFDWLVEQKPIKRIKAPKPAPVTAQALDAVFIEAAWNYLEDFPNEKKKLAHRFDNAFDGLSTWLEAQGLSDEGFSVARHLVFEMFCVFEVAELNPQRPAREAPSLHTTCPEAVANYLETSLAAHEGDENLEMADDERARVRSLAQQAVMALRCL